MLPELQAQNVNELPVLKADALKFLTIFRSQIPKDACLRIFEQLVALLGSESNVVHTYAATAVERLLSSKVTFQMFPCQDTTMRAHVLKAFITKDFLSSQKACHLFHEAFSTIACRLVLSCTS